MDTASLAFWIAIGVVLAVYISQRRQWISVNDAKQLLEQGGILVDVRTTGEYTLNHIPDALNIPLGNLAHRYKELEPLDKPIILYCKSGMRSAQAVRMLKGKGFTQVHNLGTLARWS